MTQIGFLIALFPLISIHTPAKGVTYTSTYKGKLAKISIHTPAKGVTCTVVCETDGCSISIHTPAKGVTKAR